MLRDMKKLESFTIQAQDGDIGSVHSFYFDDQSGFVRYLVVETGNWLTQRQVLISPEALGKPDWTNEKLPVNLTKKQIEESPPVEREAPVSRQMETHLRDYYSWTHYWQTAVAPNPWQTMPPAVPTVTGQMRERQVEQAGVVQPAESELHLRSSREVIGYHIQALDGEIGHVETFLVDDASWRIHYLVVDTRNWLPGKKVLIAPEWIEKFVWKESKVFVDLTTEQIQESPEYDDSFPVERAYEAELYDHYDTAGYWRN